MKILCFILYLLYGVFINTTNATFSYPFRLLRPQETKVFEQTKRQCSSISSPFASMIGDIPDFAGLKGCLLSNLQDFLPLLMAKDSKCSLQDLTSLLSSKENEDVFVFRELLNALTKTFSGLSSNSNSVKELFDSWAKEKEKTKRFCKILNEKIGPCMDTLIPNFIQVIEQDTKGCCSELNEYLSFIQLIVPKETQVSTHFMKLFQSVHLTFCTEIDDKDELCGHKIVNFLSQTKKTNSIFLLEVSVPLYAMSKENVCENLQKTTKMFTSNVNSDIRIEFTDLSCCAIYMVPLLNTFDASLQHLTGNTAVELMNLIAGLQEKNTFVNLLDTIKKCPFKAKCTKPSFEWTNLNLIQFSSSFSLIQNTLKLKSKTAKTIEPKEIVCKLVEKCDVDNICRQICQEKSVQISPWLDRAIHFQWNQTLLHSKICRNMQLLGSHNSYNNLANGFGVRDVVLNTKMEEKKRKGSYTRTNNQYFSIFDQLNLGVRFLEVDVHFFGHELRNGHCSSEGFQIYFLDLFINSLIEQLSLQIGTNNIKQKNFLPWTKSLMGCVPSLSGISSLKQPLHVDNLKKIANWLKQNPNELIFLYTEIGEDVRILNQMDNLIKLYRNTFDSSIIFTPKDLAKKKNKNWSDLSLQELRQDKKQIVLFATPKENELMFQLNKICDGWSNIPPTKSVKLDEKNTTGNSFWGLEMNQGKLVRAYHSVLHYGPFSEDEMMENNDKQQQLESTEERPTTVDANTLPLFIKAGVNILAPDAIDGQVLAAMVWSWAPKEPSNEAVSTVFSSKDGRWYGRVEDDTKTKWTACVEEENRTKWTLVEHNKECPKGTKAGTPVNGFENHQLLLVVQDKAGNSNIQDEVFVALSIDPRELPRISKEEEDAFEKNKANPSEEGDDGKPNESSSARLLLSAAGPISSFLVLFKLLVITVYNII